MSILSEIEKSATYLRTIRDSIVGRGGEISATAGLRSVPDAIWGLPVDVSLGFRDSGTGEYVYIVPTNVMPKATIKSIGGAAPDGCAKVTAIESRGAQIIPFENYKGKVYKDFNCEFIVRDDGGIDVSGTPTGAASIYLYEGDPLVRDYDITISGTTADSGIKLTVIVRDDEGQHSFVASRGNSVTIPMYRYPTASKMYVALGRLTNGVACSGTIYPMLNYGTTAVPFEKGVEIVDTFTIPESVQNLPAYGYSLDDETRNYITWIDGKAYYIQMVDEKGNALADPITTDISHLITTNNLITVRSGGSITTVNADKLGTFSTINYIVDTGG